MVSERCSSLMRPIIQMNRNAAVSASQTAITTVGVTLPNAKTPTAIAPKKLPADISSAPTATMAARTAPTPPPRVH